MKKNINESRRNKRHKRLRLIGLIIGLSVAVWWILFGITSGSDMELSFISSLLHTALPGLMILLSIAIAWKWKATGGVLLIAEAIITIATLSLVSSHCSQMNATLVLTTMSLPLLLCGVFFVFLRG